MKTLSPNDWSEFLNALEFVKNKYGTYSVDSGDDQATQKEYQILYRGQVDKKWELSTTLERKTNKEIDVLQYMQLACSSVEEIESFTNKNWNVPDYPELEKEILINQEAVHQI